MIKKLLAIGISIFAVILLTLISLSNVVGYQTVQSSNQSIIKERINQRELLFQTIVDIANNKEIQRIILKSQMSREIFPTSEIPVLTKNQIRQMYFIGLMLSKIISKAKVHSMVEQYQFISQGMQKEISAVIEKDATIKAGIFQLQNSECDCENIDTTVWEFPIICMVLYGLTHIYLIISLFTDIPIGLFLLYTAIFLAELLYCSWLYVYPPHR